MSGVTAIPINLACEDELSEAVQRKLLATADRGYHVGQCFRRGGYGYLRSRIRGFNQAARGLAFFVLTDLDEFPCATALIDDWISVPRHPNLLFRVAVREVESWLLADKDGFAKFLRVEPQYVPALPDTEVDAKRALIGVARRSPIKELREAVVPRRGSTASQGPDYNRPLVEFVVARWNPEAAARRSDSLNRTIRALSGFSPSFAR